MKTFEIIAFTGIFAVSTMVSKTFAETTEVTPYIAAERAVEAQTNKVIGGVVVTLPHNLKLDSNFESLDPESDARFELSNINVDLTATMSDSVHLYVKNDFNRDFDHSETTLGVKVTF